LDIHNIGNMKLGWFIGPFEPNTMYTDQVEVGVKEFEAGEQHDTHYHEDSIEINYLIEGEMVVQGMDLYPGDIFTLHPYEVSNARFKTAVKIVVVRLPKAGMSTLIPNDKIVVPTK